MTKNGRNPELDGKPLFGKTILMTRAMHQTDSFRHELEKLGAKAVHYPVIKITQTQNTEQILQTIERLGDYDWLVFTSVNAVECFMHFYQEFSGRQEVFNQIKIAAVGSKTEQRVEDYGLTVTLLPKQYLSDAIYDALIQVEPDLKGKRFLIPRAKEARDVLPTALISRGATVNILPVYQTETVEPGPEIEQLVTLLRDGKIDWLTFTSASTVNSFKHHLAPYLLNEPQLLKNVRLASIGPQTSQSIRTHFDIVNCEAEIHTISGLIHSILSYEQRESSNKEDKSWQ